jgi:phage anti-repressor protein
MDARNLHRFLEVEKKFAVWITRRIKQYGFVQGVDFTQFHNFVESHIKAKTEYKLSIPMAKALSIVENNDKGAQARQYFIWQVIPAQGRLYGPNHQNRHHHDHGGNCRPDRQMDGLGGICIDKI